MIGKHFYCNTNSMCVSRLRLILDAAMMLLTNCPGRTVMIELGQAQG